MKFNGAEFTVSQAEAIEWAAWFVKKNEMQDEVAALLIGFMESGQEWNQVHSGEGAKCPKCHGRGHNNLILIGQAQPGMCTNCGGTGRVAG